MIRFNTCVAAPRLVAAGAVLLASASALAAFTAVVPAGGDAAPSPDAGPAIVLAQANGEPTEKPVTFSAEQSDAGKVRYEKDCAECHGKDLKGGMNGGAPLRGLAFEEKYADEMPASALFEYMRTAMPPNSPGRYSEHVYADLMAYILDRNGFRAGAPLPTDLDVLDYMIIDK